MNDMESRADGTGQKGYESSYATGIHDPAELQRVAAELERLAASVSKDVGRAKQVIDAVHTGVGANVEKVFSDAGIRSRVTIETTDVDKPVKLEGVGEVAADSSTTTHETHHTEVHIDIGPIHLSVSVDKESDTSTVTH